MKRIYLVYSLRQQTINWLKCNRKLADFLRGILADFPIAFTYPLQSAVHRIEDSNLGPVLRSL